MSNVSAATIHSLASGRPSQKYPASCHCGLIRYTVTLSLPLTDPDAWVTECNCSICSRNGYLNVYVQSECIDFHSIGGLNDRAVEKYHFGRSRIQHYFCGKCGSSLMCESVEPGFYEGVKAVNVRMFEGLDVKTVQKREVDGRSL
jgi:hypothetical protein